MTPAARGDSVCQWERALLKAFLIGVASGFAAPVALAQTPIFERASLPPVTSDGGSSRGVAWGDYDRDGDPDLVISNTDNQPVFLYRNDRVQGFSRVETPFGRLKGYAEGVSLVDIDNDGWLDLFVARTDGGSLLFRNEGGRFRAIDGGALTKARAPASQGCWADFDNDGFLDVFLANRGGADDVLYRNLDGARFEAVAGPFKGGDARVCAAVDLNGDRLPDIFVGNFIAREGERSLKATNALYVNRGDFKFEKATVGHAVNTPSLTYAIAVEDYDQDGDADVFVGNIALSDRNYLYENLGQARLYPREDLAPSSESLGPSKGAVWGDFDNDQRLDLFVAEGTEEITADEKAGGYDVENRLFLGAEDGFRSVRAGAIVEDETISAGAAAADFDLDGDLDIAVANWGGNDEDNSLYRNLTGGAAIMIALEGVRSNRMGIGAVASIEVDAGSGTKRLYRQMAPQTGYASANEPVLHFGLSAAARAARLRIEWPSGAVDEYASVEPGRYRAREGARVLERLNPMKEE